MPLSIILIVLWVVGIPAFVVFKAMAARSLIMREDNTLGNTPQILGKPSSLSPADDRNQQLALAFISSGYLFQRYRLQYVWWEAVSR